MKREPPVPSEEISFAPPHCPYPQCRFHYRDPHGAPDDWKWVYRGFRSVRRAPRWVRRMSCCACRRWFSSSTFRYDHWRKKPALVFPCYDPLSNGAVLRQTGRILRTSPTTVRRNQRYLAGQSLLLHRGQCQRLAGAIAEPVVLDGLRTFAGSQNEAVEANTWATTETGFMIRVSVFGIRRSGTMRPGQRRTRQERERRFGVPDPDARFKTTLQDLRQIVPLARADRPLELRSDEEPAYARAVRRSADGPPIAHRTVSSRLRRDGKNPLWRINHLHRLMRHSQGNLKRETIAGNKHSGGLCDRALIGLVWLNNTKGISERRAARSRTTPAMLLGLTDRPLFAEDLFLWRRFPAREGLEPCGRELYEGRVRTRPHEPVKPYVHRCAY